MHYKRWHTKAVSWFKNLGCYIATDARPEGEISAEEQEKFEKVDAMFKAALFSILGDNIVDPYMTFEHGNGMRSRPNLGSRTLALNCMSWSNTMTTR